MKTKFNHSKLKLAIVSAIVAGFMGLSATSYAATETGTMEVSTSVSMSCTISAAALVFPAYDPTHTINITGTGSISYNCTPGGSATITLGEGLNPATSSTDSVPVRRMTGDQGGSPLPYEVFKWTDEAPGVAGGLSDWGNTQATGRVITGDGSTQQIPVWGRIFAQETNISAGSFSDSIAVTFTY